MSSDIFQEMSEENILKMLEALQQDWPKHFTLFQIVTVMREYKKAGSPWQQTIYVQGDYENGVYLHKVTGGLPTTQWCSIYIYTPSSSIISLKECLDKTKVIPWYASGFMFHMIDSRFRSIIKEVCASKNLKCHISANTQFWYPPQKEINPMPIPDDLSIEFLDESFAEEINRNWPHKSTGSELVLAEHIRKNFSLGLFKKCERKLLCSALSNFSGGIFVLFTDPEHRGKGYASLIVERMTMEIRKRKRIPFCTIIIGNKASESTFTRVGFEHWSTVDYIHFTINT